jgi:hypothetical protein
MAQAQASRTPAKSNELVRFLNHLGKLVGKLTGFDQPLNDCSDAAGNVYIVDSQNHQVRAYKHGAKSAFRVLGVHALAGVPRCSVEAGAFGA